MSERKINLENILHSICTEENKVNTSNIPYIIKAMKQACKETLELAAENATCFHEFNSAHGCEVGINIQSILNTINQIE